MWPFHQNNSGKGDIQASTTRTSDSITAEETALFSQLWELVCRKRFPLLSFKGFFKQKLKSKLWVLRCSSYHQNPLDQILERPREMDPKCIIIIGRVCLHLCEHYMGNDCWPRMIHRTARRKHHGTPGGKKFYGNNLYEKPAPVSYGWILAQRL